MQHLAPLSSGKRPLFRAERAVPERLAQFLADLETTTRSVHVWELLVALSKSLGLPFVDFICASNHANWKQTLFIRTSYDSSWLSRVNSDPELQKYSYFRAHAVHHLTPITVGLAYIDDYIEVPEERIAVLREAALRGFRAGLSIPLRLYAPPQAAIITFGGPQNRTEFDALLEAHGWTLNTAAIMAHQRYMTHFVAEFPERNGISDKQRELLELVGLGLQDKQIADRLQVSISAIRQRMAKLMEKAEVQNRAGLAALAMSMGILPDPLHRPGTTGPQVVVEMDEA